LRETQSLTEGPFLHNHPIEPQLMIADRTTRRLLALLFCLACPVIAAASAAAQSHGTSGTPIGDWKDIRGTNYVVTSATSRNNVQMWLNAGQWSGTFDRRIVEQEIALLARHHLNSIRIFGSFHAYVIDRNQYLTNVKALLAICLKHSIRVTFVLWDMFGLDGLEVPELSHHLIGQNLGTRMLQVIGHRMAQVRVLQPSLPPGMGGTWFSSPGNAYLIAHPDPAGWSPVLKAFADAYLDDVAWLFQRDYPGTFLSYDIANEPENLRLVAYVTTDTLIRIAARLGSYSMGRILKIHAKARYTVGLGDAFLGTRVHREMKKIGPRGIDYLSYHDYYVGHGFDVRAFHAAAVGLTEKLEVVCSECFTAARQGHLQMLLAALDAAGLGGQIWGAIQDRIFVVRYDQAFQRVHPGNPSRWWVYDSGVFRPVADTKEPTGWRYDVKNDVFARALMFWSRNQAPLLGIWPRLLVTRPKPNVDPDLYKLTVQGEIGLPVTLLVGRQQARATRFPGFGIQVLDGPNLQKAFIGWTWPSATPGLGEVSLTVRIPPIANAWSLPVQALLGDDYSLLQWEKMSRSLATPIVLIP
jgi:hypothetical protein